jgi:hypothetical protein
VNGHQDFQNSATPRMRCSAALAQTAAKHNSRSRDPVRYRRILADCAPCCAGFAGLEGKNRQ